MTDRTELLVVGAGPYGVAVAAHAMARGIGTRVLGRAMGFWTDNMPAGMFLRSGPDWHLDASGIHTFEAFLEDRDIAPAEIDPVPISVFLDYAGWFQAHKRVSADDRMVERLEEAGGSFVAHLSDGGAIAADRVVAAPGNRFFRHVPEWAAALPPEVVAHTCDVVDFDDVSGGRVLIVGGRQNAYEWAALFGDHGAERIDIVHRHDVPDFDRVSWKFVDRYVERTIRTPGWWRSLDQARRDEIAHEFWRVGRLTLEWWLTPRISDARFHRWAGASVVDAVAEPRPTVTLSNGRRLEVDRIVLATGYRADISRVPYLEALAPRLATSSGFPSLDHTFQSSVAGLYLPGFVATQDFGPFFGFTKGCPAAATLVVEDLLAGG
ncbi:MAG TPA: NAD(P)-binding domain-containing protein [Acidimicrobiales bacterium]|nr:NAD(P)-binding domain-containing protein [Acidimicrobiales bacterium]